MMAVVTGSTRVGGRHSVRRPMQVMSFSSRRPRLGRPSDEEGHARSLSDETASAFAIARPPDGFGRIRRTTPSRCRTRRCLCRVFSLVRRRSGRPSLVGLIYSLPVSFKNCSSRGRDCPDEDDSPARIQGGASNLGWAAAPRGREAACRARSKGDGLLSAMPLSRPCTALARIALTLSARDGGPKRRCHAVP